MYGVRVRRWGGVRGLGERGAADGASSRERVEWVPQAGTVLLGSGPVRVLSANG